MGTGYLFGGRQMKQEALGLLDPVEFAERLGVSIRYVRRLIAERRIEYVKVGHLIRFEPSQVDAWIDDNRVQALRNGL
jgi:excisionase family DNA binding protein